jgi:hypothetical protein
MADSLNAPFFGIRISRNNLLGVATPIMVSGGSFLDLLQSVIRKNLGVPSAALPTPPTLVSGAAVVNTGPFDYRVAVTGGSNFQVKLGGMEGTLTKIAPSRDAMYFVPVGMTIEVDLNSGHDLPSWSWFAQGSGNPVV